MASAISQTLPLLGARVASSLRRKQSKLQHQGLQRAIYAVVIFAGAAQSLVAAGFVPLSAWMATLSLFAVQLFCLLALCTARDRTSLGDHEALSYLGADAELGDQTLQAELQHLLGRLAIVAHYASAEECSSVVHKLSLEHCLALHKLAREVQHSLARLSQKPPSPGSVLPRKIGRDSVDVSEEAEQYLQLPSGNGKSTGSQAQSSMSFQSGRRASTPQPISTNLDPTAVRPFSPFQSPLDNESAGSSRGSNSSRPASLTGKSSNKASPSSSQLQSPSHRRCGTPTPAAAIRETMRAKALQSQPETAGNVVWGMDGSAQNCSAIDGQLQQAHSLIERYEVHADWISPKSAATNDTISTSALLDIAFQEMPSSRPDSRKPSWPKNAGSEVLRPEGRERSDAAAIEAAERLRQYVAKSNAGEVIQETSGNHNQSDLHAALSEGCNMAQWKQRRAQLKADRQASSAQQRVTYGQLMRQQHEQALNPNAAPCSSGPLGTAQSLGKAEASGSESMAEAKARIAGMGFGSHKSVGSVKSVSSEVNHAAIMPISEAHTEDLHDRQSKDSLRRVHNRYQRSKTWHVEPKARSESRSSPNSPARSSPKVQMTHYKSN